MEGLEDNENSGSNSALEFVEHSPKGGTEDRIVVYYTSLRGIRKTYEDCCDVRMIFRGFRVCVDERDISMDSSYREELQGVLGRVSLPQVFIRGRHIGGADEIKGLNEAGELEHLLKGFPVKQEGTLWCRSCGDTRFLPCPSCRGSRKVFAEEEMRLRRCQDWGFMPFAYPGMTPPIMPPPVSTPSTFVPRMVPIRLVNLAGTMNEAAPSNVHEVDEAEQEAARRRKGKAIAKPSKTRDSAFKRLGDKEDGPRKSAKLRLGPEMGRTSAMERLGGNHPAQSRRSRESETIHLDEDEAESQPRALAYTRLSYDEDDLDKIGSVARKLRALEEKVEEKAGAKKHTLAKSPFSARVHAQKLRRKVKLDVEKFTGKEDPNVHLDTFHNAAQMAGCTDAEECLLFFSSLRRRPVEWFNGLPHGRIGSFEKFAEVVRKKYQDNCIKRKKFTYLNTVGQREKESLTQFLTRWRDEVDNVEEMDDKTAMSLLMNAFRLGDLYTELCRRPPSSYQEAYNTAWEYAKAKVLNKSKREIEEGHTKVKSDKPKKDDQTGGSKPKATYDGSIHQIRDEKKGEQHKQPWTEKWCTYHQSDSHNMTDCRNVRVVLREMTLRRELARVHAQKLRRKVKLDVEKFTGKEDPNVHLDTFHNAAQMAGCTDAEECLLFFSSLRGRPVEWFNGLPHGRIGSFEKFAKVFRKKYQDNCIKRKKFTYLNTEAYNTAWEYAEAEVLNKSKRELEEGHTKVKSDKPNKDDQTGGSKPKATYDGSIHQIRDEKKGEQHKRPWIEKWCTYHQSDSHNTTDCRNVRVVLREITLRGELGEIFVTGLEEDP
ncbi:unnamed protein product [Cuscuta campestris]|uniref:Uncharacterized protein n=1 Tax=Cuscuta campestris TaxID=132261 RepID=A0A484KYF7_9ASTE|nr:unnamed protein product [Cuscuta campestris]